MKLFWENQNWEKEDRHFLGLKNMPFERVFPAIDLRKGLYSIRGPRQIGKSSWLKKLLKQACNFSSPSECFFLSCENLTDFKDLAETLALFKNRRYIFLDEITFVKDWARPIKHLIDSGYNGTIIVTGSNTYDLRKGVDRMPGREGFGEDLFLLPMNFQEYLKARKDANWKTLAKTEALEKYFRIGGFPLAIAEAGEESTKTSKTEKLIEKWILGDIAKIGKNENYTKEIISQVVQTMTSTMSSHKLAQRTQVGSHHTIADYLQVLEDMFIIKTLNSIDPDTGAFRFKKEKKFYLTDPIYTKLGLRWLGLDTNDIESPQLAEQVAHEYLSRKYDRFGFLTSAKNGEVDFFAYKKWAVEIKWSDIPSNLSNAYKNLVVPKKIIWAKENFLNNFD
jgi:predicted AAA+ superfamily ATPase